MDTTDIKVNLLKYKRKDPMGPNDAVKGQPTIGDSLIRLDEVVIRIEEILAGGPRNQEIGEAMPAVNMISATRMKVIEISDRLDVVVDQLREL